jgi:hypothetical protein
LVSAAERDAADITVQEALAGNAELVSRLVVAWHVFDACDDSDDPKPLPLPATQELVAKLPREINAKILTYMRAPALAPGAAAA